ncbi:hypothetical protein D9M71_344410 [compost metagenome]|uniref:DUF2232 domain-containing protein n=1 Tax=Pseudomonas linyingensis TaxID=915471 RepID=A0A1H6S1L3_9PSED|nr:hypothetical protein [Pseudomonas linyingensis]SEI58667.1 hypothetical protein SAMN05216201_101117 [Pseudomonas linyingensis]
MRALADFVMRGRLQATFAVVIAAALPLLFWVSAAAGSLVVLRRGLHDALGIVAWALLPTLLWWHFGEPRPLLVLFGTLVLALVLRASVSWTRVLLASVLLGVLYGVIIDAVFGETVKRNAAELLELMPQMLGEAYQQMSADEKARVGNLLTPVLTGLMAALLQLLSLLSLLLGRYWQALLYNPGGFAREFRAVRLPAPIAVVLLVGIFLLPGLGIELAMLTPLCSVPLAFAGVALLHGLVAQQRLGRFWLVGLYVSLLLFMQLVYPLLVVLAVVDSLFDFRGRAARDGASGPTDGEG